MTRRLYRFFTIGLLLIFLARAFCGLLWVETFEDEGYVEIFIKKRPTLWRFIYEDPYASDPIGEPHAYGGRMDAEGDWFPRTVEFEDFLVYCRSRFGVEIIDPVSRNKCKIQASKSRYRLYWPYLIYLYTFG